MITPELTSSVKQVLERTYYAGASGNPTDEAVAKHQREIELLIKAEAVALADKLIGKDRVLHSHTDIKEGVDILDREDKAVYDFQVAQRVQLARYQNPQPVSMGIDVVLNSGLSPNEE